MQKNRNKKPSRSRKISLVSYLPVETIREVLKYRSVRGAVLATHDRDTYTEDDEKHNPDHKSGTLKDKHTHVLLCLHNAATIEQVRGWFPSDQNTLGQVVANDGQALRYLTHKDNPEKAQYADEILEYIGEGAEPFQRTCITSADTCDTANAIIDDLLEGVSLEVMRLRYGRELMIYYEKYARFASLIKYERAAKDERDFEAEWNSVCTLHAKGILSEYEYLRLCDEYGIDPAAR